MPVASAPLGTLTQPPQIPLKQKDYPHVKFWLAASWTDSKADRDIVTTSPKPEKKRNGTFWYLEDANGTPLSDERITAVTLRARQIFTQLNLSQMGAAKWGDMGNISQDYYRSEMYSFFPELRLCELDWKVNRLATETYSSWYRKRKGKLTVPVKREEDHADSDGGDMVISQAPKRPGPPLESTTYARKVKSSCNALKPPPAQASTHTPAPRETRPQPTPGPCFNSVPSDIPGAAAVALTATNTSTMASISSTPAPLSLPPLASSVSPSTDRVQPLDSNSPDARSTTSLPHMTTTTVTMPVTGALLARTHAAELQLPSHDSEMLTLSPDIQDEDTETGCMDTSEKDIGLAERPNAQVSPLSARHVAY